MTLNLLHKMLKIIILLIDSKVTQKKSRLSDTTS